MKIGCFACVEPFASMRTQFAGVKKMGFDLADVTDVHDGASLGEEFGFAPNVSLDAHPSKILTLSQEAGIELSTFCSHANLIDPTDPSTFGTAQIIKALRLAKLLGIKDVITCDGEPVTAFGKSLTDSERLLIVREKLQSPIAWAEELGMKLLIETHGPVSDNLDLLGELLDKLGHEDTVGICLDTGNCWLGGGDPVDFVKAFSSRIGHIHWKEIPESMAARRGKVFGCGMTTATLGEGVANVRAAFDAIRAAGIDVSTTLEIAGADAVIESAKRLREWGK